MFPGHPSEINHQSVRQNIQRAHRHIESQVNCPLQGGKNGGSPITKRKGEFGAPRETRLGPLGCTLKIQNQIARRVGVAREASTFCR